MAKSRERTSCWWPRYWKMREQRVESNWVRAADGTHLTPIRANIKLRRDRETFQRQSAVMQPWLLLVPTMQPVCPVLRPWLKWTLFLETRSRQNKRSVVHLCDRVSPFNIILAQAGTRESGGESRCPRVFPLVGAVTSNTRYRWWVICILFRGGEMSTYQAVMALSQRCGTVKAVEEQQQF